MKKFVSMSLAAVLAASLPGVYNCTPCGDLYLIGSKYRSKFLCEMLKIQQVWKKVKKCIVSLQKMM